MIGAASGFAATGPMTAFMLVAHRLGWTGREGPEAIVQEGLDTTGVERDRRQELAAIIAAHFAFGTGSGVVYATLARRLGGLAGPIRSGVVFGVALWAANYQGWVPAAGILPPASRDRSDRQARLFWAHVVYGSVLGYLSDRLGRGATRP